MQILEILAKAVKPLGRFVHRAAFAESPLKLTTDIFLCVCLLGEVVEFFSLFVTEKFLTSWEEIGSSVWMDVPIDPVSGIWASSPNQPNRLSESSRIRTLVNKNLHETVKIFGLVGGYQVSVPHHSCDTAREMN